MTDCYSLEDELIGEILSSYRIDSETEEPKGPLLYLSKIFFKNIVFGTTYCPEAQSCSFKFIVGPEDNLVLRLNLLWRYEFFRFRRRLKKFSTSFDDTISLLASGDIGFAIFFRREEAWEKFVVIVSELVPLLLKYERSTEEIKRVREVYSLNEYDKKKHDEFFHPKKYSPYSFGLFLNFTVFFGYLISFLLGVFKLHMFFFYLHGVLTLLAAYYIEEREKHPTWHKVANLIPALGRFLRFYH